MNIRSSGHRKLNLLILSFCILPVVVLTVGIPSFSHASGLSLEYSSGRLSVNASNAPLEKVLKTLSLECGLKVFLDSSLASKRISAKFDNLSLEQGIKKLVSPYSSAIIFEKMVTSGGRNDFYISEIRVFDNSNKKVSYILVGRKTPHQAAKAPLQEEENMKLDELEKKVVSVPQYKRDPAKAAAFSKRVSASVLRTRLTQKMAEIRRLKQRMNREEQQKIRNLEQLKEQLEIAPKGEKMKIQSKMSLLSLDLNNSRKRYDRDLKRLQRGLDQLKNRLILQEGSLARNDERVPAQK
ncbi:MAG: hypothetical protein JRH06_13060 [Deltaproteobacteria bacterium]|nr:hypothetical protein [Deltaproteobacteria bacterium]MBW2138471.1 hypothetical protein [Deltaproteobacteria bacterium]